YAHPGAYTVKLFSTTFEPGPVCSPIDSIIKVVAIYPEGRHNLPDTVFCRNDTLRLGFEHLPGATYKWTPSAGLSSDTIANPLVYVTTNRSYTLVMNAGNCRDTTSFNLIANGVSAAFTHTLSYCERDSITLSNKSVGATAYSWDFGDASGSTQFSPRHAWPDQGEYIIRLVAINDTLTTCSKTDTAYSKMIVYPRGSQTLPDTIICRSDSLQIGYAPIPGATYKWTPANGLSSDTIANPYVFTDTTRTYTLTIRALSCRDTTRITVIPRGVGARFEASTGICGNLPVVFSNKSLGANTYRWDFGDGSAGVSDTNTSHVYPGPGSYTAVLVAYSLAQEGNCPISDTFRLEVNVYPSGVHVLPDSVVCLNDTIRLGSEPIPGAVYEWIPSNGLSSDAVANPILTPDTTRNYILITRAYGCVDSAFIKLIVNGVKADFTFTANLCEDDSIRFTNKSNRGSSWIWRFGDGQTSTLRDVKHPFAEAGIYNVTLIARTTTPGSCPATDTVIKAVTIYPQGYKLRPDTTICRTDTIRIGYPTLPGATYYWTPPTGISNPSVADPFFFPDTNITYTLVSSAAGCTDTTVLNIKVEGAAASFTATPATCAQDTIFFTNTSLYTDTYRWNFGDGSAISNDTSTYHIYSQPGIYRVQLVGESSLSSPNCPATDTAVTYVVIHPTGHHYWPDTVVCKLSVIQIPFDSLPGATYTWSSSYGLSDSTIARPDITVTGDVQYDVIARAGSCIDTLSVNIITLKYDLIPFTLDTLICSGPSFTLVADGRGEIQDFTWSENLDFSTRLNSGPTDSTITVFPVTLKKYYVRGIVNNCVFIDSVRLIVAQGTTTVLPDVNLCYGDSVRIGLQVNPQPGESFKWTPADFLDDDDIPFPQTTTQDSITYRLHAVLNGCFEYFTVNVNVRSFDLVAYRDTILCDRYTLLVFTASGVNVLSNYVWSDKPDYSNVLNPNGDNMIAVRPPGNMDYYVKAMFGNCKYYDTVSIHADYITLGIDKTVPYCDKQNIVLDAQNQGGPLTYKWTPSTYIIGPDNREQVELKLPSTERMVLITTNVDGCVQRDTVLVYPDSLSFLTAEILASDTYFYKGTTIRLEGFPIGNYNYQWSPAATVNRPTSRITDAYANDSVWVYLSVSNNTCAIRDSIFLKYVEVICGPPNVFVPNAFTPNTDSQNDTLLVRGNHIELLYFTIYDRWGEKIFETSDQSIGWDGNWKGKPLDPAVFVYYLQMTCKDRQTYFEKGNITLIR
ncbi:MAG: PKD domain-containing protein, partial [Bacteroidota bacterium]